MSMVALFVTRTETDRQAGGRVSESDDSQHAPHQITASEASSVVDNTAAVTRDRH